MKQLVLGATVGAVLALAVPVATAATTGCAAEGTAVGRIKATNVSCAIAAKVIHADEQGKSYGGFKCTSTPYAGGAKVVCKTGAKSVRFEVAD